MTGTAGNRTRHRLPRTNAMRLAAIVIGSLLAGAMTIAGCSHSPPMRYVTLSAAPAATPLATGRIEPVQLTALHIPGELDRPEVVTQISGNQLSVDEGTRWGAPLARMMRRTLAEDLLSRLPEGSFVLPDSPAPTATRALVVTVLDLEIDTSKTLRMQAAWTLSTGRPDRVVLTRQATLSVEMPDSNAAGQAASLSRALGELADRIAASIPSR
ncbi:MAG: PqiC family protein [Trinickia sp.]|uniref:PqiC family protein n=1 Tax=Trinickia sp. TaxID=2571163 RepID=UPI003F7F72F7